MSTTRNVRITVRGRLSNRLAAAFDGLTPLRRTGATDLVGEIADQAQLPGLLSRIRADPSPLVGLGIGEIVDHYDRIVRSLDEPPILIGHSFGGLFVQLLLDRGLGAGGVAIDSAPPKGIFAFEPTSLLSLGRILLIPFGWRKVVRWSFIEFRYAFVHTMSLDEAQAIWDAQIVPDSGRPFFQAAFPMLNRASPARVDFANPDRAPLMFIAGEADRAMPPALVKRMYRAHRASPARTDLRSFPGRTHWLIAQHGWEEVAQACLDWIESLSHGSCPKRACHPTPLPPINPMRRMAQRPRRTLYEQRGPHS